ncbi:MAG: TRAP transporter large permease subunit [Ferrovibrio sp.]|uniref:TRAP transporter large permease n=1 Tax=Ferrovibrio sp. TaxID=1917215 RepID=UPI002637E55F|nr:TRAP transporter large permease subunit [Ferrovibrio sp.]MCW0232082.1 TRAP transporter large permease subunit [Ferrovibrio sp.]
MNSNAAIAAIDTPLLYARYGRLGTGLRRALSVIEYAAGLALAVDVAVVFASVIYRYFLHDPVDWAEEIARALMVMLVFFGAASALGRNHHAGIDVFRAAFPERWQQILVQLSQWVVAAVSLALLVTSYMLLEESAGQTTPLGLPHGIYAWPVVIGSLCMALFSLANAFEAPRRLAFGTLASVIIVCAILAAWHSYAWASAPSPLMLLLVGFIGSIVIGVPIAFALAFASLVYFVADPSLPMVIYSQQVAAGADHFVLLAIPFFVLAGLAMEANGMSSRLIELLLRMMGRLRGGINLITIVATAVFSGISGSKLADIAAVGGIIMPAVRRSRQDPNETAGLLACTAVMAETIPPCVNMIIFAFVANVSVGGLFVAGLVPAAFLALLLATVAIWYGGKVDPEHLKASDRSLAQLIVGSLVALIMILMIGRGVMAGLATSTEISAFAVVYALVVGGLAFRELTMRITMRLFVQSAAMAGSILFIVAAASGFAYALTIEQIPSLISATMIDFGHAYGSVMFVLLATVVMIFFGAVLEGAPALIIFGPLLTPIAAQLGVNPLHFGTVMVIAMGFGLFAPPVGLGLFATCTMTGTRVQDVARPMMKYLAILALGLVILVLFPTFSLWLPAKFGMN